MLDKMIEFKSEMTGEKIKLRLAMITFSDTTREEFKSNIRKPIEKKIGKNAHTTLYSLIMQVASDQRYTFSDGHMCLNMYSSS